jgi:hypothetical protein
MLLRCSRAITISSKEDYLILESFEQIILFRQACKNIREKGIKVGLVGVR